MLNTIKTVSRKKGERLKSCWRWTLEINRTLCTDRYKQSWSLRSVFPNCFLHWSLPYSKCANYCLFWFRQTKILERQTHSQWVKSVRGHSLLLSGLVLLEIIISVVLQDKVKLGRLWRSAELSYYNDKNNFILWKNLHLNNRILNIIIEQIHVLVLRKSTNICNSL